MLQPIDIEFSADQLLSELKHCHLEQDQFDAMWKCDINQPTDSFYYDAWQLKPEYSTPAVQSLFAQLPPVGQAKIVSIPPSTSYHVHADIEDRYHITLQGQHSYLIDLAHHKMYSTQVDNQCYHMDTARIHTAVNFGYQPRIQLVIRHLLHRPLLSDPVHVHLHPVTLDEPHNQRQLFDQHILTWLNLAHKQHIIDNFNPMGEDVELQFDLARNHVPQLQQQIAQCGFDVWCRIT